MSRHASNRVISTTVIGRRGDAADRHVLLELGLEKPVDWEAVDGLGEPPICGDLRFILEIDSGKGGVPCRIVFVLERALRCTERHDGTYVYLLGLSPARDERGRPINEVAVDTARRDARLRGRRWTDDVRDVRLGWARDLGMAEERYAWVPNDSFLPDAPIELPAATDDEVARMCDAFDAFCDGLDGETIELGLDDIEFIRDAA